MSFLNGLRRSHLLRRKTLDATNSRITQPLMEETQTVSITTMQQPTEANAMDCCLMEMTADVADDRDEIQQIIDVTTNPSTNINTTSTNSSSSSNTMTTTTITNPTYTQMLQQHTTTTLVTITTPSSINSTVTIPLNPAVAAAAATTTNITNHLGALPIIQETSISATPSSTCNKTNIQNQSSTKTIIPTAAATPTPATLPISIEPNCLVAYAITNNSSSTADITTALTTNNNLSSLDYKLVDETL